MGKFPGAINLTPGRMPCRATGCSQSSPFLCTEKENESERCSEFIIRSLRALILAKNSHQLN